MTISVCFLFLIVVFSTGCDDKMEGNNTSGNKTNEDDKTGDDEPIQDVSGGIKVQQIEGYVNQTAQAVTDIRIYIALHSGTDAVDIIDELDIHFTWTDNEAGDAVGGAADLRANNSKTTSPDSNVFWSEYVADPHGSFQNSGVLDQDSVIAIYIRTWELQQPPANADLGEDYGFDASSSGTLKFIVSGMSPTVKGFNMPGSFPDEGGWVELY